MMNLQKLFSIYDGVNSQEQEDEKKKVQMIHTIQLFSKVTHPHSKLSERATKKTRCAIGFLFYFHENAAYSMPLRSSRTRYLFGL